MRTVPRAFRINRACAHATSTHLLPVLFLLLAGACLAHALPARADDHGRWFDLHPPQGLHGHAAIYDPVRDRLVIFGGAGATGSSNELWTLTFDVVPTWSPLVATGPAPDARTGHSAIYDPLRERMVVFGGRDQASQPTNEVWVLSLAGTPAWSRLEPSGELPAARDGHAAIYDPIRDEMVVHAGRAGGSDVLDDTWALPLCGPAAWRRIVPGGTLPPAQSEMAAIYDPLRDRLVIHGAGGNAWALTLGASPAWKLLATWGPVPWSRSRHVAAYDAAGDRMLVYAGFAGAQASDLWALSFSAMPYLNVWTELHPAGTVPPGRFDHVWVRDTRRNRMVLHGGAYYAGGSLGMLDDVRELSLAGETAWDRLPTAPGGTSPEPTYYHASIYDPVRDRLLVYGGSGGNDVWEFDFTGEQAWTRLETSGSPPSWRGAHTAIHDPVRDRMVVFGGTDWNTYFNDTWSLSLGDPPAWTRMEPAGTPPPVRAAHTAVYDPDGDRMIVFGGVYASYMSDTWALSLAGTPAWTRLTPTSGPTPRCNHSAVYDPADRSMVVFGGLCYPDYLNDTWSLRLTGTPSWSQLSSWTTRPSARAAHTAVYDAARGRIVIFGGYDGADRNDTWSLLAGWSSATWTLLSPVGTPPSAREAHTAMYDPVRDRMVVFGGWDEHVATNDTWALTWGGYSAVPAPVASSGTTGAGALRVSPNPFHPSSAGAVTTIRLDADGRAGRVSITLYDAAGRLVRVLADGMAVTGSREVAWDGRDRYGRPAPPGLYVCRLEAGNRATTVKIILSR